MTKKGVPTREAILLATIDCIEEHGLEKVTTRMIAERAGANVASINYYFRTKGHLIEEALTLTVTHMLEDVMVTIEDRTLSFQQVLRDVLFYLIKGGAEWPGISSAHLYSVIVENDYDSVSAKTILQAFDRLHERAQSELPDQAPEYLRLLLADIFAAVMFKMPAQGFFKLDESYQPEDEARCRRLADHYVEIFYALLPESGNDPRPLGRPPSRQ